MINKIFKTQLRQKSLNSWDVLQVGWFCLNVDVKDWVQIWSLDFHFSFWFQIYLMFFVLWPLGSWFPPVWSERRTCPWRTPRSTGNRSTEHHNRPPGAQRSPACWFLQRETEVQRSQRAAEETVCIWCTMTLCPVHVLKYISTTSFIVSHQNVRTQN